jgi:hypothetical protein
MIHLFEKACENMIDSVAVGFIRLVWIAFGLFFLGGGIGSLITYFIMK